MAHPIVHFEMAVTDSERSRKFYSELFDWKIEPMPGMDTYFGINTGQQDLGGGMMATEGKYPPHVSFYVLVDDLQAYLDKAEKLGAKTMVPPSPIPGHGSFAIFADPDGIPMGIYKAPQQG